MHRLLVILLPLALTACSGSPAERRIRQYFALPAETPGDTVALRTAILQRMPRGTPADTVRTFLASRGVGQDGLSAYYPAGPGDTALVRIEFDPHGWNVVAVSYDVRLVFDSAARLTDVRVARWLTGP